MTKFSDFYRRQELPEFRETVSGTFGCQRCDSEAEQADFDRGAKLLTWKCERGHLSYIEDFEAF